MAFIRDFDRRNKLTIGNAVILTDFDSFGKKVDRAIDRPTLATLDV